MEDERFEELLEQILEDLGIEEDDLRAEHVIDGSLTDTPALWGDTIH